jgi:hypothetical protein
MDSNTAFKRKFRWTIATSGFAGYEDSPETFVKVESQDIPLERFAVCSEKSSVSITTYECAQSSPIVALAAAAYDESKPTGTIVMKIYDGCGNLMDSWNITGCAVTSTEFFDLDMETTGLKMTFLYDRADHRPGNYTPIAGPQMGLGMLGHTTTYPHKRNRHRWVLEADFDGLKAGPMFVKVPLRPSLDIQETENGDGTKEYNSKWQDFKFTIDATDQIDAAQTLWPILAKTYQFVEVDPVVNEEPPKEPLKGKITLKLVDGAGTALETWTISDAYFVTIDFGELDFQSSDATTIECGVRFQYVEYNPKTVYEKLDIDKIKSEANAAWWKSIENSKWVVPDVIKEAVTKMPLIYGFKSPHWDGKTDRRWKIVAIEETKLSYQTEWKEVPGSQELQSYASKCPLTGIFHLHKESLPQSAVDNGVVASPEAESPGVTRDLPSA